MRKRRNDLRLDECFLFAIESPRDLARRLSTKSMQFSEADLLGLSAGIIGNYKLFKIDGRPIQEPKRRLQAVHLRVHRLLSKVAVPEYLHSAVRGRSYISNAAAHARDEPVIKIDIKKFFASVPHAAILRFLRTSLRCRSDVAKLLANLLTFEGKIPTGSSASPILAYYAFKPMFDEISALATSLGLTFTCYVDDMTFSGRAATNSTLMQIRTIVARYGLKSHKVRKFSANDPKVITGVCVASEGDRIPNKLHRKIAADFKSLEVGDEGMQREKTLSSLLGRLQAAGRINPVFKARASTLRASASRRRQSI
ncbi:hypothetical protein HNQ36_004433 [Afipia massiliensis]|uniref:Reverse transcriptase domain-containing protein n=1 Tax=Afipia massiliensis TaxID=211460 RepID=A0A840N9Q5_9BRAD|nr:reverse transcriptase family protein [Afipia massiliensis]MBB5054431.1 hypothetical protein [Afipia massiliensis]